MIEEPVCSPSLPCDPSDARGVGPCTDFLGFIWSGTQCVGIAGCSCEGADCDKRFAVHEECEGAYSTCPGP